MNRSEYEQIKALEVENKKLREWAKKSMHWYGCDVYIDTCDGRRLKCDCGKDDLLKEGNNGKK